MPKRVRSWCWTLNNPTDDEILTLCRLVDENQRVRYITWQREMGDESTEHLQGFIYMHNPCSLTGMKKLQNRAHFEEMKGTIDQAIAYCRKDETRWELLLDSRLRDGFHP